MLTFWGCPDYSILDYSRAFTVHFIYPQQSNKIRKLRIGSKLSEPYAYELINFLYRCRHVFLTVVQYKQWRQTPASTLLKTCSIKESLAERQKRSKAWLHFTKKDGNHAALISLTIIISSKGGNTSNMLKHLSTRHGLKLQKCHVFDTLHECHYFPTEQQLPTQAG